jgi:cytochrome c oxidase subunit II
MLDMLDGSGRGADAIADLWWVMFWLSLIPTVIVLGMLVVILLRRRRQGDGEDPPAAAPLEHERGERRIILLGGVALPLVLLLPVVAMVIATAHARERTDVEAMEIGVTGHRFWWDLRYPAPGNERLDQGETFRTANELHIPVGRPVDLVVESEDVIHSIWIPRLDGKIDLTPGRTKRLRIEATEPGVHTGRCAEFCGASHALMRLRVVAHPQEEFEAWLEREAGPVATEPDEGMRMAFGDSCAPCHDLRGVWEAGTFRGNLGPDLTHLASRRTIAAGILPNTREALGRWIIDPQRVKPDNNMPANIAPDGGELADIVDFLEELE